MWNCFKWVQTGSCCYLLQSSQILGPQTMGRLAELWEEECSSLVVGDWVWGSPSPGNNPALPCTFQALEPQAEQQDQT